MNIRSFLVTILTAAISICTITAQAQTTKEQQEETARKRKSYKEGRDYGEEKNGPSDRKLKRRNAMKEKWNINRYYADTTARK
jgi:hypothetical protein